MPYSYLDVIAMLHLNILSLDGLQEILDENRREHPNDSYFQLCMDRQQTRINDRRERVMMEMFELANRN